MDKESAEGAPAAAPVEADVAAATASPAALGGAGSVGAALAGGRATPRLSGGAEDGLRSLARMPVAARAAALARMQRGAGNGALAQRIAPSGAALARQGSDSGGGVPTVPGPSPSKPGDSGGGVPEAGQGVRDEIKDMTEAQKVERLQKAVDAHDGQAANVIWNDFGARGLELAHEHPELFTQSMALGIVADGGPFRTVRANFKADVEAQARNNLKENKTFVEAEMDKLGAHGVEGGDKSPTAAQQHELHDLQKWAVLLADAHRALDGLSKTAVGYSTVKKSDSSGGVPEYELATFHPGERPEHTTVPAGVTPPGGADAPKLKAWDEVKKSWDDVTAIRTICEGKSPALHAISQDGDPKRAASGDVAALRDEAGKGMVRLIGRIDKAIPLVGSSIDHTDLVTIHDALFAGPPGASGTSWRSPVENAIARQDVKDADAKHLLASLGLGALSAAAFLLVPFTGGASALFLATLGAAAAVAQPVMSWSQYSKLKTAEEATGANPRLAIVSKEQVGSALIAAIMDTAFAVADIVGAGKAYKAAAAGRALLKAGEAGTKQAAESVLRNIGKEAGTPAAVTRAVAELGPHEAQRVSGKSFEELAAAVGRESEQGKRLLELAKLGPQGAQKAATEALVNLKKLGTPGLASADANGYVMAAIDQLGVLQTVREGGGWKALTKAVGEGPAASRLEAWRVGIFDELKAFMAKETENSTKAVRTGTEKATSDLDIQAVGGEAALNAERANQWLAARLNAPKDEVKKLLDMAMFVDPTRSHLYDVVEGLSPEIRAEIAASQAGTERRMMYGARLHAAKGDEAAVRRIIEEAAEHGVADLKEFVPLSPELQKDFARQIDGLIKQIEKTTNATEKATLVKQAGEKQAMINASNPDAYIGGGVRIHVSGRDIDAAKLEAAGVKMYQPVSDAQRVVAAMREADFFNEALHTLQAPEADAVKVAGALKDIGKHGERAATVAAGTATRANEELITTGARMELLAATAKRPGFVGQLSSSGEMDRLVPHAMQLLQQARGEVNTAIRALERTAKIVDIPPAELEALVKWAKFLAQYEKIANAIHRTLPATLEGFHQLLKQIEDDNPTLQAPSPPAPAPAPVARKLLQRAPPAGVTSAGPLSPAGTNSAEAEKKRDDETVTRARELIGRAALTIRISAVDAQVSGKPVEVETLNVFDVINRPPSGDPPRRTFESAGAATAYMAVIAAPLAGAVVAVDDRFVVVTLKGSERFQRLHVRQVDATLKVVSAQGTDGAVFPIGKPVERDADQAAKSGADMAGTANAADMRGLLGVKNAEDKQADAAARADLKPGAAGHPAAVAMSPVAQEDFLKAYFRSRAVEVLEQNSKVVDGLYKDFQPTSKGNASTASQGISPSAQKLIDSSKAMGPRFREILEKEAKAKEYAKLMDWHSGLPGQRGTAKIDFGGKEHFVWEVRDAFNKLIERTAKQKAEVVGAYPMLATMVPADRSAPSSYSIPEKAVYAIGGALVGIGESLGALGGKKLTDPTIYGENQYDASAFGKGASDEELRKDFLAKLDDIRKAMRETRSLVTTGSPDFLMGLSGLRARVASDVASKPELKKKLEEMLAGKDKTDKVINGVTMAVQIGLLFVPGGQVISAAMGLGTALNDMDRHLKEWDVSKAAVDPAQALVDQQKAKEELFTDTLNVALAALDLGSSAMAGKGAASAEKAMEMAGLAYDLEKASVKAVGAEVGIIDKLKTLDAVPADKRAGTVATAVEQLGTAQTVERSGKKVEALIEIAGKESAAGKKLAAYAEAGKGVKSGELTAKLGRFAELSAEEAAAVVNQGIDLLGGGRVVEAAGGWAALESKLGKGSAAMDRMATWRAAYMEELAEFLAQRKALQQAAAKHPPPARGGGGAVPPAPKPPDATAGLTGGLTADDLAAAAAHVQSKTGLKGADALKKLAPDLASAEALAKFVRTAQEHVREGFKALSAEDRMVMLMDRVNARLAEAGAPPAKGVTDKAVDPWEAKYDPGTHTIHISEATLSAKGPEITEEWFNQMLGLAYHEARHAEQNYAAARYAAGESLGRNQAKAKLPGIDPEILEAGLAHPIGPKDHGYEFAREMFEAIYGKDAKHRAEVLADLDHFKEEVKKLQKELAELNTKADGLKAPGDAAELKKVQGDITTKEGMLEFKKDRLREADAKYRMLAEEEDAYGVQGDLLAELAKKKKP